MKILIDDDKPDIQFRKGEVTSLTESVRLCSELGTWLDDEMAHDAAEKLRAVIARYIPQETQAHG